MNINVQEIVNAKLKEMEEGKVLETLITTTVEKAVTKAVTDAIDGYSIKRILEKKIEDDVKAGVEQVGFMAYNTVVADQVSNLINSVIKDDLAVKISGVFERVMLNKREEIKLSEIIEEYRKQYEEMDFDDIQKLEDGHFFVNWVETDEDCNFRRIELTFALEAQKMSKTYIYTHSQGSKDMKLEMCLSKYRKDDWTISSVKFEDKDLKDLSVLRKMGDFEALVANLCLNDTKIIVDMNEDDIDTYVGGSYWD